MLSITDLLNEQASNILDGLEKIETVPITIGLTKDGKVYARNSNGCHIGSSYRDALSQLIQSELTK